MPNEKIRIIGGWFNDTKAEELTTDERNELFDYYKEQGVKEIIFI